MVPKEANGCGCFAPVAGDIVAEAQVRFADVAGDDFQVLGAQPAETLDQLGVGVKRVFDALLGRGRVAAPGDADQRAARLR